MTGKRRPYWAGYRIGLASDGRILACEVMLYQNAGACADLSPAILERPLFHATGSYCVPNARITAASCRTNLVPFTAFRGFGGPLAMLVIEAAPAHAAHALGRDQREIQRLNLLSENDEFPYGQRADRCRARRCWDQADRAYGLAEAAARHREHNRTHRLTTKGSAVMLVCFGISFANVVLHQGRALVHVYTDGSVGVSTGAAEMGQGVNEKLRRIAAAALGIEASRVRLEPTSTTRVADTSAAAASTGSDLNGKAVEAACRAISGRIEAVTARALAPDVDVAQVEERIVQSVGWMTLKELLFDEGGRLLTDSTSTYKVPDLKSAPEIEVRLVEDASNPHAVGGSKAVGEPPFRYGIAARFAAADAMAACRPEAAPAFDAPLTPEKVPMALDGGGKGE